MQIRSLITAAALSAGCATIVPAELSDARAVYRRASAGPAARLSPVELHAAETALKAAEKSFEDRPDSFQTRDLSYVAQRKSELAEASASIAIEQASQRTAKADFVDAQGKIVEKTKAELGAAQEDLSNTRSALTASQKGEAVTADKLSVEQAARVAAEQRAAAALAALAKLATVKEEPRGLVITLSGSVLFTSNKASLLAEAQTKLTQVGEVLMSTRERRVVVEGHTDARGSDAHNVDLSQRRADAVRDYLVKQGYQADLITSTGLGEARPIASNDDAEGRANNRRVEIIIARDGLTSNP